MAEYKYVGEGQGIPGLPNEISNARAKSLGVEQLLKDAIKAGVYKKLGSKAKEGNK